MFFGRSFLGEARRYSSSRKYCPLTGLRHHKFVACPPLSSSMVGKTNGHNAAVDDYLVQIASNAGCRLATLDRALATRWPERTLSIN